MREEDDLLFDVKKYFNIEEFREGQRKIIEDILEEKDSLAIMPTAGGKSICYQYPALKKDGLTLVISPLISLMEDQVKSMKENNLPAERLHGEMSGEESAEIMKKVLQGEIKILYISPERLISPKFINYSKSIEISLLVVDEAHCISLFGYGFRPSYLNLIRYFKQTGKRPAIAAFTATAADYVKDDIKELLEMKDCSLTGVVKDRKNHKIFIKKVENKEDKLKELRRYVMDNGNEAGIIYCTTVELVKEVTEFLKQSGIKARKYYADLKKERKDSCYINFLNGKCKLVVATSAFGMGIDKDNVRYVIHFDMPRDMESYVQEMGRAGRDGKAASCILFYNEEDSYKLRRVIQEEKENLLKEEKLVAYERKLKEERLEILIDFIKGGIGKENEELQREIELYFKKNPISKRLKNEAEEIRKYLQKKMNYPNKLSMNLTKIAGCIRKKEYEVGQFTEFNIGEEGRDKSVKFKLSRELSYFDICIADVVYSLYYAGKEKIYVKNIIELLSGDENALIKKPFAKEIEESLERMRETNLEIDMRDGNIGFGREKLLKGKFLTWEREGKNGYHILETPLLHQYAELTNGQIAGVSLPYLKVERLPNSKENLMLIYYFVYSIKIRKPFTGKRKKKINRNINIENAIIILGIELPKETSLKNRKLSTIREKIEVILIHEKNLGLLTDYKFHENGKSVEVDFL